jgi:hypothetical protein
MPPSADQLNVGPEKYNSAQDFLEQMDAGELDGEFLAAIKKLSQDQLEEVAQALMDREEERRRRD